MGVWGIWVLAVLQVVVLLVVVVLAELNVRKNTRAPLGSRRPRGTS
jgi:hypothetical protein